MAVEFHIEGEEAAEVAPLRLDGRGCPARNFRDEVRAGRVREDCSDPPLGAPERYFADYFKRQALVPPCFSRPLLSDSWMVCNITAIRLQIYSSVFSILDLGTNPDLGCWHREVRN